MLVRFLKWDTVKAVPEGSYRALGKDHYRDETIQHLRLNLGLLETGRRYYLDEHHVGPGWVSFLSLRNELQWGWTPCSPVPQPVCANKLLNKSVLVPASLDFWSIWFWGSSIPSPSPFWSHTLHLAASSFLIMNPPHRLHHLSNKGWGLIVFVVGQSASVVGQSGSGLKTLISRSLDVGFSLL